MTTANNSAATASKGRMFVAYLRVSTDRQGRSGLGLEAQQAAIASFVQPSDRLLAPPFVEVESGKQNDRPKLAEAMARCRKTGATLLIAKLDRLSRDAHFLLGLHKAGVDFIAADMPHANRLTVGIMALVAEEEARATSARTKAALQAAKARGKALGGVRAGQRLPVAEAARKGSVRAAEARVASADAKAFRVLPRIEELAVNNFSLARIAAALEAEGVPTPRGGAWTATAVRRVRLRVAEGA